MGLVKDAGISCACDHARVNMLCRALASLSLAILLCFAVFGTSAQAQSYTFNSVKIEGNQRIESGTILTYLGIDRGKSVSAADLNDGYQRLADSGVFENVELIPQGSTLIVKVDEYPTINQISFEGNRRVKDETLSEVIQSAPRRVFDPTQAENDATNIAIAYSAQGRTAATVTPRIIRRSENRVDLVFEIAEGQTIEVERVSFVGNRVYTDRRLRRVLETKQANFLRTFLRSDNFVEDRIEFDKQVLRDFYLSRGYVDFRVNSANAEFTQERDAFFLVVDVTEGQQFTFGQITTVSEISEAVAADFQDAIKVKPGVVYSPALVENEIARLERLAIRQGIDFLRVEPRISRNDRDLSLDVEFALVRGPRIFVERIDIEGNTTTLDRVVRQQFRIVEGDPFNPREIRESAERIRALGFFSVSDVETREGSAPDQVIIDVDVAEQPTGSLNLGGAYSVTDGFGISVGLTENNFLGRGQRLAFNISTATEAESYILGFSEPNLLGRQLRFDLDLGTAARTSSFASYDANRRFFQPALSFALGERSLLKLKYSWQSSIMEARSTPEHGNVIDSEIQQGRLSSSAVGFVYAYDTRLTGLNPNAGFLFEFGSDFSGLGGDQKYIKTTAKAIAQTKIFNEEVTLRATLEGGALNWMGDNTSRTMDRFVLYPEIMRGFEPGGLGPRDMSPDASGNAYDDFLGGNLYAVARFEAEFPLGLPEELGLRAGIFYDVGNLWDLKNTDLSGAGTCVGGCVVGADGAWRQVIGLSILWTTGFGPLRFNFTKALSKETYDKEQTFDLTLQARF
ncbi:outer membrane protein assembly factor BamA [Falsiphaeobacter marinintestinus]|uniref:outer membrane protein assembly factor BamA n=1 Tax=Falsiphaeobacter marinintestinus TaxID=1492905 RepID=UPI0011B68E24|nr:outer membrane protein assembly factor BamA [Phaeobacter marinintestinus]